VANTPKRSVYNAVARVQASLAREIAITRLVQDMRKAADYAEQLVAGREEPEAVNAVWDFIENFEELTTTVSRMAGGLRPALDAFKQDFPGRKAA
jgi:hypothetical protein